MSTNIEVGYFRREAILSYFERVLTDEKRAPTLDEIGEAVGLTSKSSVQKHLLMLVDEGRLVRRETGVMKAVYTLP